MIIKFQGKYIVYEGTYTAEYKIVFREDELVLRISLEAAGMDEDIAAVLMEYECGSLDDATKEKVNEIADNYLARCLRDGYLNTNHFKRYMHKVLSERMIEEE